MGEMRGEPDLPIGMTGLTPMLKVADLAATIEFYTNILGFRLENTTSDDKGNPNWCSLKWGKTGVMFYTMGVTKERPVPPNMTGVLYFNPTDVKALWQELKDKTHVEWELQAMEYGMLEFAIRDCN